ncbi:hypothetical protein HDU76_011794 [Blyttiomyces sp. JEL0837]|nr:hypothetical protein HDU76_011794 [Blyttiomyces sp. JEL0837]
MDPQDIPSQLREVLKTMITTDTITMRETIIKYYDQDCRLQNPYMILNGREEIIRSYNALASSNMDLKIEIDTITFDKDSQTAMVDMLQFSQPKALGGLVPLKIHQILKLQLESSIENPSLLVIAQHHEVHVAQDYLAQLPIVGGFYDNGLRSALGQITIAGSGILNSTGLLDMVPWAVDRVGKAASATKQKAGEVVGTATSIAKSTVAATGVPTLISAVAEVGGRWVSVAKDAASWVAEEARGTAASLIEEGKGVRIDCYSPTCRPGLVCYSPTCLRGKSLTVNMNVDNLQSIVKGMYIEGGKRTGLLKSEH